MLVEEFLGLVAIRLGDGTGKGKGASDCNWGRGEGKGEFQERIIGK